jgi:hypothetical protein
MIGAQLQAAIVSALKAPTAICGGRIYDKVPAEPVFPYITLGDEQALDDGNSCEDGWEVFSDIHIWSRSQSFGEAKGLVASVVPRVVTTLTITGFTNVISSLESSRSFRDPDGLTSHAIVTVRHVLQPA